MKLCKDCKHVLMYHPMHQDFTGRAMCGHPEAPTDPVFGLKYGSCSLMRSRNCLIAQCGFDGDWFEQAQTPEPQPEMKPYVVAETVIERSAWERVKHWFI